MRIQIGAGQCFDQLKAPVLPDLYVRQDNMRAECKRNGHGLLKRVGGPYVFDIVFRPVDNTAYNVANLWLVVYKQLSVHGV